MKRTDGLWVEVTVIRLMPNGMAILLDRLLALSGGPAHINEGTWPQRQVGVAQRRQPDVTRLHPLSRHRPAMSAGAV